jgi:hypothetical protein
MKKNLYQIRFNNSFIPYWIRVPEFIWRIAGDSGCNIDTCYVSGKYRLPKGK